MDQDPFDWEFSDSLTPQLERTPRSMLHCQEGRTGTDSPRGANLWNHTPDGTLPTELDGEDA